MDEVDWLLLGAAMHAVDSLKARLEREGDWDLLRPVNDVVRSLHDLRRAGESHPPCPACGGRTCVADRSTHTPF